MKQMHVETSAEEFDNLMQTLLADPVIKKRILEMLQLSSFERCTVLNNWLEQLRTRHASEHLLSALTYLFDDKIAEQVLALINDRKL